MRNQAPDELDDEEDLEAPEADDALESWCPHCGEPVTVFVDATGGGRQEYVEDCPVCCRPWTVRVSVSDGLALSLELIPSE